MVVRMSNNIISYNYLSGLNKALYKQVKAQEQLYTQKRLNRPSDNPVDTVLDMRYKVNLVENEQHTRNTDMALSWMDTTHESMDGLNDILQRVRELVIRMGEPNPDISYDATAEEIDGLIHQAIQIGNTTLGDRYIFAGQNDRGTIPFYLKPGNYTVSPPAPPDEVVYLGDDHKISMVISSGAVNPALDGVNMTGNEVFNNGKFFEDLIQIRDVLRDPSIWPANTGDPGNYLSETAIALLDENHDALLTTQSFVSAKVSMYNLGQSLLDSVNVRIQGNISDVEDVNIGDASIAFTVSQNAYQAALATGAKLLPMSLLDFLR